MTRMQLAQAALVMATTIMLLGTAGCRRLPLVRHNGRAYHAARGLRPLAPLPSSARIEKLGLSHFAAASVFVPVGARFARPIVIAMHGEEESPEAACDAWSTITNRDYFVLCPALGVSVGSDGANASCTSLVCLEDELREVLVALRGRFGRYVAPKEVMLVGRAAGAARVVPIALQNPAVFSAVWLVGGGLREWSSAVSVAYAQRGGKFLGIACSGASCDSDALRANTSARMAGLTTAFVKLETGGAPWGPKSVETIRLSWEASKPKGWPWAGPGKSEHFARSDR